MVNVTNGTVSGFSMVLRVDLSVHSKKVEGFTLFNATPTSLSHVFCIFALS